MLLALIAAVQAAPAQTDTKTFGDWAVACDNIHFCEAASLVPEEAAEDDWAQVAITRDAGPAGKLSIDIAPSPEHRGGYRLDIDGQPILSGTFYTPTLVITGAEAERLAAAMLKGQQMLLRDRAARVLSRVSLKGIAATLRYIDAGQGRAGTVTAIAAKGAKPASAVPAAPAAPRVAFVRPAGKAEPIPAPLRAKLEKQAQCDEAYVDGMERPAVETFALGGGKTLALIPCGAGAYNFSSAPFIIAAGKAVPARFDQKPGWTGDGDAPTLVNADFDAKTGQLGSYAKGRGIGDCGSSEAYVWDGAMFRLVEAHSMGECRGSINWLRNWKAQAVPR